MLLGQPSEWSTIGLTGVMSPNDGWSLSPWLFDRLKGYRPRPYDLPPVPPVVPSPAPPPVGWPAWSMDHNAAHPLGYGQHAEADSAAHSRRFNGGGTLGGDFVTLPDWARQGLSAAAMAPSPVGAAASLANAGMRINNLVAANRLRAALGLPELSLGQVLGGVLGLNGYGSTDPNARRGEIDLGSGPTAVTVGGLYDRGGWFGSDLRTAFTPMEAIRRVNALTPANRGYWGRIGQYGRGAPSGIGHGWGGAWGRGGGAGYGGPGGRGGLSADPTPGKAGR